MQPTNDVAMELQIEAEVYKTLQAVEEGRVTAEAAQGVLYYLFTMWKRDTHYHQDHLFAQDHDRPCQAPMNGHDTPNPESRRPSGYSNASHFSSYSSFSGAPTAVTSSSSRND